MTNSLFLALITTNTDAAHQETLAARRRTICAGLRDCGGEAAVMRAAAVSGMCGVGDYAASAYSIPGVLHFVYTWKALRQYTMTRFPPQLAEYVQRKALLRAYQHVLDCLVATTPPVRHAISTYYGLESVGHVAGIHTTNAILLAAFDPTVVPDKVAAALEKLAKAVRRDHDKLLMPSPSALV